jgi:hypothetical protein
MGIVASAYHDTASETPRRVLQQGPWPAEERHHEWERQSSEKGYCIGDTTMGSPMKLMTHGGATPAYTRWEERTTRVPCVYAIYD